LYHLDDIEDELNTTKVGKMVLETMRPHLEEVFEQIVDNREVTVVWHRNKGPAFFGYFLKSGFDKKTTIPIEIQGVTLQSMIRRMAAVLQEQGSTDLSNAIAEHIVLILKTCEECASLRQIIDKIKLAG
jgi:transcriptional regulator NrdR family protein